jgi:hypothetical protein
LGSVPRSLGAGHTYQPLGFVGHISTGYLSPLLTDMSGVTARWDTGWGEPVVLPFFLIAALLLALGGYAKLRNHRRAARALEVAGLGGGVLEVRLLGSIELIVGAAALLNPTALWSLLLAALYAGFGGFLLRLRSIDPEAECGCMGDHSQPAGPLHIGLDFMGAAAGFFGWLVVAPGVHTRIATSPLRALTLWLGIVALAYLIYAAVRFLPAVFWPRTEPGRRGSARSFAMTR